MLDALWLKIYAGLLALRSGLDWLMTPVDAYLGPAVSITILAAVILLLTSWLGRFKTRRYKRLEKDFWHWFNVRQTALEASNCEHEQRKALAQGIDKGKLNEVYYNYFFEGLLNNLVTRYIPIMLMAGYINAAYRPKALEAKLGQESLFTFGLGGKDPIEISGVFWFVCCLVFVALAKWGIKRLIKAFAAQRQRQRTEHAVTN
jgi:hypothetical protein